MSLLASCTERRPAEYYFAEANGSGPSLLSSPTLVESDPGSQVSTALRLTCDLSGNTAIIGTTTSAARIMSIAPNASVGSVINVAQNAGSGIGYAQIGNPSGGTAVSIAGQTSPNGTCTIQASGSGTLQIGANGTSSPDNLTLNADHTVTFASAPILPALNATVTLPQVDHGTQAIVSIPAGAQSAGLYCLTVQTAGSTNVNDATAHLSTIYYWNGTQVVSGGAVSGPESVGGPAGAYSIQPYAAAGVLNQFVFINTTAGAATTPTLNWIKLAGPITGFP